MSLQFISPISTNRPYQLPLNSNGEIGNLSISITNADSSTRPTISFQDDIEFSWSGEKSQIARSEVTNFSANGLLSIRPQSISNFSLERHPNGKSFIAITLPEPLPDQNAKRPSSILIYWDTSLSHQKSASDVHEFVSRLAELYDDVPIEFVPFANGPLLDRVVKNNEGGDINAALQNTIYHGATNLDALFKSVEPQQASELCLLVTDGRITLGDFPTTQLGCKLYAVTAAKDADRGALNVLAKRHGGRLIDLSRLGVEEALSLIEHPPSTFIKLVVNGRTQNTELEWSHDGDSFRLVAPITDNPRRVKVHFDNISFDARLSEIKFSEGAMIGSIWASQHQASLRASGAKREELVNLGKSYSVASEEASFIVLESIEDYVEERIAFPANGFDEEEKESYFELLKMAKADDLAEQKNRLNEVVELWGKQLSWYEISFDPAKFNKDGNGLAVEGPSMSPPTDTSEMAPGVMMPRRTPDENEESDTIIVRGSRLTQENINSSSPVFQVDAGEVMELRKLKICSMSCRRRFPVRMVNHRTIRAWMKHKL